MMHDSYSTHKMVHHSLQQRAVDKECSKSAYTNDWLLHIHSGSSLLTAEGACLQKKYGKSGSAMAGAALPSVLQHLHGHSCGGQGQPSS